MEVSPTNQGQRNTLYDVEMCFAIVQERKYRGNPVENLEPSPNSDLHFSPAFGVFQFIRGQWKGKLNVEGDRETDH